ncbi:MAG: hypothetical protein KDB14_07740 [Planctomycetales bacterium]|nr:hypothetical protein [Planctomycetales bacterium]
MAELDLKTGDLKHPTNPPAYSLAERVLLRLGLLRLAGLGLVVGGSVAIAISASRVDYRISTLEFLIYVTAIACSFGFVNWLALPLIIAAMGFVFRGRRAFWACFTIGLLITLAYLTRVPGMP